MSRVLDEDRYQHGLKKMLEYQDAESSAPAGHIALAKALEKLAPDVSRYMVEFAFGDIYDRPGLDKQEQALVTISSLTALGTKPQIKLHVNTGLNVGLSLQKIVAAIVHLLPYIGFPRVLNALGVVKQVAAEHGIDEALAQGLPDSTDF